MEYATVISCAVSIREIRELFWPGIQAYKSYDEAKRIKVYYKVRTDRDVETVLIQHGTPDEFVFPMETLSFDPSKIIKQQGVKRPADAPLETEAKKSTI